MWAVIVLAALFFLFQVRSILPPFVVALLISALLDPAIKRLREKGMSLPRAVWSVFLVFFATITLVGILVTPVITSQVGNLRDKIEDITGQISSAGSGRNFFVRWNPRSQSAGAGITAGVDRFLNEHRPTLERFGLPTTSGAIMDQYVEPHRREITKAVEAFFNGLLGIVSAFGSQILLMLFTPVFVLLILLDMDRVKRRSISWIPPSIRAETLALVQDISNVFVRYLRGVTIVLIWYAIIATILLTILGAPFAVLLAILFALIYLIPYVGPLLNAGLLLVLTTLSGRSGNWFLTLDSPLVFGIAITLIYFVLMLLFDPLVYTRIVGNSVGLHPVISFFVVFSGAALFGAVGMILAFPVAGSLKVVLDRLMRITTDSSDQLQLPSVPLRHRSASG